MLRWTFRNRILPAIVLGITISTSITAAFAATGAASSTTNAAGAAPATTLASAPVKHVNFGRITDLSLSASAMGPASVVSQTDGKDALRVMVVRAQSRFTDAPLPKDIEAPTGEASNDEATLQPDFFQRSAHQAGDALAEGAGANQQRRGHGSMAAGVALAVPMD